MRTLTCSVALTLLFASLATAQQPTNGSTQVELKLVQADAATTSRCGRGFDKNNQLIFAPFANEAGKLTIQREKKKIRLDTNGDGIIDDKDDPAIMPKNTIVKVNCKIGGKTIQYPICFFDLVSYEKDHYYLMYAPLALLEGKYNGYTIRISETHNPSGRFHGQNCAVDVFRQTDKPAGSIKGHPWSPILVIDDKMTGINYLPEGPSLTLTPYTGPVAKLKLDTGVAALKAKALITSTSQTGWVDTEKDALFAPDSYTLRSVSLRDSAKYNESQMYGREENGTAKIPLKEGPNTLKVGPPFKMAGEFEKNNDKISITKADLLGAAGESYRPSVDKNKGESCTWLLRSGGKEKLLGNLEYG